MLGTVPELEPYSDWQAPPLAETRLKGGVGIVADQAACPFRAFARHRLFAEAPETVEAGLDVMTHGVLLHKAMAGIWNELKTHSALAALSLEALEKLISRYVDFALSRLDTHGDAFRRAVIEVERGRLARLIRDWLQRERQRPAFEVLETEFPQTLRIGGRELQLRADRIDRLESGKRLIIDYKSGAKKSANVWWGDRPDEPQLPMYALLEPPADAIALATLHAADSGFVGLANVPDLADGIHDSGSLRRDPIAWADLMEHWQRTVASLVENFAQGNARVDPKMPGTCSNCEVKPLCRLHELAPQGAFAENEATGDE
jgi:probable DNA repair protein